MVNVHNVHYGSTNDGKGIVLKKLGSNHELAELDNKICQNGRQPHGCDVANAAAKSYPASGTKWMLKAMTGLTTMTTCPTERLVENIMDKYFEKMDSILLSHVERTQLMTTLTINQEPIVFQTFSKSAGWPFPEYLGACGRFVAIESNGLPLHDFFEYEWKIRARIALKMLEIADQLTNNKVQYALYWTDLNYGSFHVDVLNGDVYLADGRHIMVVDRWQITQDKKVGWDEPCYSEFTECSTYPDVPCRLTIPDRLCQCHESDHNFYAVCRNLLSSYATRGSRSLGFLHDVPKDTDELYNVQDLVDRCAKPEKREQRTQIVRQLMKALKDFLGPQPLKS